LLWPLKRYGHEGCGEMIGCSTWLAHASLSSRDARLTICAIALVLSGLVGNRIQAEPSRVNGGDNAQVGDLFVTHLSGHTLYIPKGYISSFMGYASHLQIRALLPCLEPETPKNANEFHKNTYGLVLTANLNPFSDNPYRVGQALLDKDIELSAFAKSGQLDYGEFIKTYDREYRDPTIGPYPVPGSRFVLYDDALMKRDIFVLPGSDPLLVIECQRYAGFVGHTECETRERALGDLHLWYWYDGRPFVDPDVDFAATIDERLQRLLESFLTSTPKRTACN
jgi:hypothetical protein